MFNWFQLCRTSKKVEEQHSLREGLVAKSSHRFPEFFVGFLALMVIVVCVCVCARVSVLLCKSPRKTPVKTSSARRSKVINALSA